MNHEQNKILKRVLIISSTATTDFPNLASTVHDSTDLNHEARLVIGKQPRSCCDYVCDDSRACRVTRLSGYTCCITAGCGECVAAGCGYVTCNHYFSFGSCGCSASLRCSDMVLLGSPPIADNILLLLPCLFPCLFPCLLIDAGRMCVLFQMIFGIEAHNCLTMAIRVLRHMGVSLPPQFNNTLYKILITSDAICDLNHHLKQVAIINYSPTLETICEHIKLDNVEELNINRETVLQHINKFISGKRARGPSIGPKEAFLGDYTLLALAVIYNAKDTVRFLVENCQDDVNFLFGRRRDCTVLDLALSMGRKNIAAFLQKHSAITGEKQGKFLEGLYTRIKKGDLEQLRELIKDYKKNHNGIFEINQSVHIERTSFEAFFLGVCSFLAVAIIYEQEEMVRTLCHEYGADTGFHFGRGNDYTALSYAKLLSHFSLYYVGSTSLKNIIYFLENSDPMAVELKEMRIDPVDNDSDTATSSTYSPSSSIYTPLSSAGQSVISGNSSCSYSLGQAVFTGQSSGSSFGFFAPPGRIISKEEDPLPEEPDESYSMKAKHNYCAKKPEQLSFVKSDVLTVLNDSGNWWYCELVVL